MVWLGWSRRWLGQLLQTISYITIIPLAGIAWESDDLSGLAKFLPLVGALIGLLLAASFFVLHALSAQPLLSATIIVVLWLIITGGLHFDGLMDTADGLCSHTNRERMLEIMHDSRVGNFAVIVGICTIILKIAALSVLLQVETRGIPLILLLSPCLARLAQAWAIGKYSYARASGKGKIWHDSMRFPQDFIWAAVVPAIILLTAVLLGYSSSYLLLYTGIAAGAGILSAAFFNRALQGHTGDTYGAVVELSETLPLVIFALAVARC